jgi:hypothetical protein
MPFTKIKYSQKDGVTLEWQDSELRQSIEHRLVSSQDPRPEFHAALQEFNRFVRQLLDLPMSWETGLTIQSVSISQSDAQGRGLVVTALKRLSGCNAPLVLNTPHLPETASSEDGPALPAFAIRMLDALEEEAAKYRAGERAQGDLFAAKQGSIELVTLASGGKSVTLTGRSARMSLV